MTESFFTSAGPVFETGTPFERKGELARDILRLEIDEDVGGMKRLSARFCAWGPPPSGDSDEGLLYLDSRIFDFGKGMRVALGAPPDQRIVFDGLISGIEADFDEGREPQVIVFAEDRLMSLRMTRRMRTYENVSDADLAAAIADEHGLASHVDAPGPMYDRVQQWNMSDLAFLRERARLVRAEVWVADDTLHFTSRGSREATRLTLVRGGDLMTMVARADLAHQRTAVRVSGYDAEARAEIDEEAGDDVVQAEIAAGRTGPAILAEAFGERVSHRVREVPLTGNEAREWARAEMLRRARSFVRVAATTSGSAEMMVGSRVRLENVGAPFEGDGYVVAAVRHTYDLENGFRTHFQAERPTVGASG